MTARRRTAQYQRLLALQVKLATGEPCDSLDERLLADIVNGIARETDVRDFFFESVKNRPAGKDAEAKEFAALDVAVARECGVDLVEAMSIAAGRWRLTFDQVEHAWRDFGRHSIELLKSQGTVFVKQLQRLRLANWKRKKSQREK